MVQNKNKISVIGLGFVGGAVHYWFEHKLNNRVELFSYDKHKNIGTVKEVNKADIVFVCVPTPFYEDAGGYDDSAIIESLNVLSSSKIVVIKSTILPGSTEKFQKLFPIHKILFNPEFLVAKTAVEDFINPKRQILGYTNQSKNYTQEILNILPSAPLIRVMHATEAEMVKYFGNAFLATKVVFANQIYDICEKLGIDYNVVKEATGSDPRINLSHLDVSQDGYRGYGGACFPKDTKAIIGLARELNADFTLLEKVDEINKRLMKITPKPLASVIITTFNRPALLKEAITSVLQQDFNNFELIIIDDYSPGSETQKAVEGFNDKRIRYIKNQTNSGSTASLNNGLNAATGKYVAILDDDDVWISKEKLSQQVKFLEENPDYVLVGTNAVVVDYDSGKEIVRSKASYDNETIRQNFLLSNTITHSSILCRRSATSKAGGYDKTLARAKDYDLLLKLGKIGKLAVLSDYFVKYRESSWNQKNILETKARDTKFKIKVIWRYRKDYPYAVKALTREIYRYTLFILLRPFYKIIRKIRG